MPAFIDTFLAVQLATMVAPVAVYFLILGLLNTRRHPQILSARQDFAILFVAICPLFVVPVLAAVGITPLSVSVAAALVAGGIFLLAPRGHNWVVYNATDAEVRRALRHALRRMDVAFEPMGPARIDLPQRQAALQISHFALLRNVTVRLEDGDEQLARSLQAHLHQNLCRLEPEAHSMAVVMLLVATAMLVAPMTFMAQHGVPQLVRLLTGLLP